MYVNIFIYYVCVSSMYHLKKSKDSRCVHLCLVTGCLEGWKLDAGHQALGLVFSQVGWGKYGGNMVKIWGKYEKMGKYGTKWDKMGQNGKAKRRN